VIGLALACLTLCAACSSKPQVVTRTELVRMAPPAHLTRPTPAPDCSGAETNDDLLQCLLDYRAALGRANADKSAIKDSVEAP